MSAVPAQSQPRPRPKSTWSFASNKSGGSRKSSGSMKLPKVDLKETSRDKRRTRFGPNQDPTRAISEDEPFAVSQNNTTNIRALPHKDQFGNLIVEPDRSNPTRPRWERPLDTIRSFEAAIDNEYKRKSCARVGKLRVVISARWRGGLHSHIIDDNSNGGYSRRSSYYAPNNYNVRGLQDSGYYGSRPGPTRPESYPENHHLNSQFQNRPRFAQRSNTEPPLNGYNNGQNLYPSNAYQQSVDTVNTASGGSYNTDPWGYSTDPSSEDSSIDRRDQGMKAETTDGYGYGVQFGTATQPQLANGLNYPGYSQRGPHNALNNSVDHGVPPVVPPHLTPLPPLPPKDNVPPLKVPIKLGDTPVTAPVNGGGKRKSWFKRFSRGN
ncbi:MAG: hypothetical protein M1839_001482 [Geoglossum umbratile]|nr:MAG: hypothetical protein M1839_001482 [Geoglossum umbratile]